MPLNPEQEEHHKERVRDVLRKEGGREPTEEEVGRLADDLVALAEIFISTIEDKHRLKRAS